MPDRKGCEFPVVGGNYNPTGGRTSVVKVDMTPRLMVNREATSLEGRDDLPRRESGQPVGHAGTATRIFSCRMVPSSGIGSPSLRSPSR